MLHSITNIGDELLTSFLRVSTSMTLKCKNGFFVKCLRFQAVAHISGVNCAKIAKNTNTPGQP